MTKCCCPSNLDTDWDKKRYFSLSFTVRLTVLCLVMRNVF